MEIDVYIIATDQQLVSLSLDNGDATAFEHLFNRYLNAIYQFYLSRTGNAADSDDLVQETFIKVYLNLHRYNCEYTFGQWIYTIARNTFVDHTRRRREDMISIDQNSEGAADISLQGGLTPEESYIRDQNRKELDQVMNRMSQRYRRLIEMRFFKEYSYEEIAVKLNIPLGTVKTQIHRAREQFCKLITGEKE